MARTRRASFKIDMGERLCYTEGAGAFFPASVQEMEESRVLFSTTPDLPFPRNKPT